ncbi:MAG TPA: hypothetical protein VGL54_04460 [Solirubrobacteraceae bacterium]
MSLLSWSVPVAPAGAELPTTTAAWWHLESSPAPTNLQPGSEGEIVLRAVNLGDAAVDGAAGTVTIADVLPASLRASASAISGKVTGIKAAAQHPGAMACSLATLSCTFSEANLEPYEQLQVKIAMHEVALAAHTGENEMTVTGGGAPSASLRRPIAVSSAPTQFGIENYELTPENEDGSVDTQAGSHPFQLTTTIALDRTAERGETGGGVKELVPNEAGLVKNLSFKWPSGLIGNPTVFPRCTALQFTAITESSNDECPADTAVGVALVTFHEPGLAVLGFFTEEVPVFSLEPVVGEPARFGFEVKGTPVLIDTSIRTGGDYGVTVNVDNITELVGYLSSVVTIWGVPGDPRHDASRGWACLNPEVKEVGSCVPLGQSAPPPFLSLPTSCPANPATGEPEALQTAVEADSWQEPENVLTAEPSELMPALDGCNDLQFDPEIRAVPDGQQASSPSGLGVDVHVPQEGQLNPTGLAQSNIKDIKVTLPAGVALNPAGANGLEACGEGLIGYLPGESSPPGELHFTPSLPGSIPALDAGDGEALEPGVNFCPNAAKIATVKIATPLLPNPLEGAVYLAAQNSNPFGSLVAMYIVAEDPVSGSLVKLPGQVSLNPSTGQIESTFENTPQLAFEDAELHFFGGETAPLSTPAHCGTYTTNAVFTPWSGNEGVKSSSSFQIVSGPNGSACPGSSLPFSPSLAGGATNINAGAFSPFTLTMSRQDGEQNMQSVEAHLPPGLSGVLSNIELCPEPQADLGECPAGSLIGETTVSVGVGGDPFSVSGGRFYLTGPYNGSGACTVGTPGCAPFGLTFEVPAKAGPFDLKRNSANPAGEDPCDCVIVRGKIEINPETAALTITSNPPGSPYAIPTSIEGIPLEIQHVNAITTRSDFQFNPTSCDKMAVTGTIHSSEGATDTIGVPFQVTNCRDLDFTPKFQVSTGAKTSKADGASLTAKVSEPAGSLGTQANLARVKVELPKQLPSRLTTLQKACTDAQFNVNPAGCPPASDIGHATVHTPLLSVPLTGPAIFVSHGGEAFPSLTMVLQGDGVTIDLVGSTFISKAGVTSTTFKTVPDQPFSTFELTLPTGKYSALTALGNLCTEKLAMPTEFVAQNGAEIHEVTKLGVTGCKKVKSLTRAQKLKRALKACRKMKKPKRKGCENAARKKYGPVNKKRKKGKGKR